MINLDAAFREQFFDVAIGQAVTQIPAHRNRDHLTREPIASRSGRFEDRSAHPLSLQGSDPISQRNSPGGSALCGVAGFQHHLGPWVPVLGGIGWIIASDNLSYLLRHRYGARIANLLSRQPPRTRLRRRLITWLHALTRDRRAGSALSYPKFALFNAAHALPWAALFVEAGYLLTGYWHSKHLGRTMRVATVVAAALVLVAAWSARRRRRCQRAQSQSG